MSSDDAAGDITDGVNVNDTFSNGSLLSLPLPPKLNLKISDSIKTVVPISLLTSLRLTQKDELLIKRRRFSFDDSRVVRTLLRLSQIDGGKEEKKEESTTEPALRVTRSAPPKLSTSSRKANIERKASSENDLSGTQSSSKEAFRVEKRKMSTGLKDGIAASASRRVMAPYDRRDDDLPFLQTFDAISKEEEEEATKTAEDLRGPPSLCPIRCFSCNTKDHGVSYARLYLALDVLMTIISFFDIATDIAVALEFLRNEHWIFFYASAAIFCLAQISYTVLFVNIFGITDNYGERRPWYEKLLWIIGIFPFGQLVPFLVWLTTLPFLPASSVNAILTRLRLQWPGRSKNIRDDMTPAERQWEEIKCKAVAHSGFMVEAFVEVRDCSS